MILLTWLKAFFLQLWQSLLAEIALIKFATLKNNKKLTGFDYLDILHVWVKTEYSGAHIILLTDINVEAKNLEFWAKIPRGQALEFLKDVVVLFCKDRTELERLISNIGSNFASAYGFSDGDLILTNKDL